MDFNLAFIHYSQSIAVLLVYSFLTIIPKTAQAENFSQNLEEAYKKATRDIIDILEVYNVDQIGCRKFQSDCLTPQDLKADLESVFELKDDFVKPKQATRKALFYSPELQKIFINATAHHDPAVMGCMGLHELLGKNNRADLEYDAALAACVLKDFHEVKSLSDSSLEVERLLPIVKASLSGPYTQLGEIPSTQSGANSLLIEGGATIIGGGGDPTSLVQRLLFYNYMMQSFIPFSGGRLALNLLKVVIPLEVIESESDQVHFIMTEGTKHGWPRHALLPRRLLEQKPLRDAKAPNRALEQVAFFLTSLAPGLFKSFEINMGLIQYRQDGQLYSFAFPKDASQIHPVVYETFYLRRLNERCPQLQSCKWVSQP